MTDSLRILVYSDDATVRQQVRDALGARLHPDLPPLDYVEVATPPVVVERMHAGDIALAVLDGEAPPRAAWASRNNSRTNSTRARRSSC
ncbi:hypothetical protein AK37_20664 [Rhodococcus pyridinivorans AK37]|uniref:Uncharacterized protein n=1 Tax=Rhodococcus pyridinivorans AK37 TaxID=1114960 RepID=H0JWM0_9NOCA|nr:hypothetical protein AK37_20664 [Rhodococcus pyridinivorans AK37]